MENEKNKGFLKGLLNKIDQTFTVERPESIELDDYTGFEDLYKKFADPSNRGVGFRKTVEQKVDDYDGRPGTITISHKDKNDYSIKFWPDMGQEWVDEQNLKIYRAGTLVNLPTYIAPVAAAGKALKGNYFYMPPKTPKPPMKNVTPGSIVKTSKKPKALESVVTGAVTKDNPVALGRQEFTAGSIPGLDGKDYAFLAEIKRKAIPNEFQQLVISLEQEGPYRLTPPPGKFVKADTSIPESNRFEEWTTQELEQLGPAFKTYMAERPYKDAATTEGMKRMIEEVNATFEDLLGPDFDQDLVRGYMKAVADHEGALKSLQEILNDKTGKLWHRQHATALRKLEHSGRMLGNKGLFPAWNFPDTLDQTPLGRPKVKITREGNAPDRTARGADFQRTLARVLGKPLSLKESILYWYDQDMFYFWKELTPLQRQQLVDSSRTRSGGRLKSELTVAENINQALEAMEFGKETMSGKIGRKLTPKERLEALVNQAQAALLKQRKYKGKNLKTSPRQGNVFYDIKTGIETDYRPDLTGKGAYWDIESE